MAREAPISLRLPPDEAVAAREAAERSQLSLNAYMRRALNQRVRLDAALESERELDERQAARRRAADVE
jgi:hypothetical protein